LGKLKPSASSNSLLLPHFYFIATRLLPCGRYDGGVKKFTGNDDIGDARDDTTQAVHAFAHFSLLYSGKHMLFCDLQGTVPIILL
jgi:hypothetical protein